MIWINLVYHDLDSKALTLYRIRLLDSLVVIAHKQ